MKTNIALRHAAAWAPLIARLERIARWLEAQRRARYAIKELEAKTDSELRDIGILRHDIPRIVRDGTREPK
jgi:uncharacterized protein YjiS (DUF1127 family)